MSIYLKFVLLAFFTQSALAVNPSFLQADADAKATGQEKQKVVSATIKTARSCV